MSRPSISPHSVRLGLLLFVALPCLPGLIFLLTGLWVDPHRHHEDVATAERVSDTRAGEQTRGLYLAGGVVLLVGTACSGLVVWKIARPTPPPADDEDKAGADSSDRSV